jgi:cysteine-S-conjugate beta-lyase
LMDYLKGSLDHIRHFIASEIPQISMCEPESTFLLWLDMRRLGLSDDALQEMMLKKAKLACDPGPHFGLGGNGFMRMNYALPRSVLFKALGQLKDAINQLD